MNKAKIEKTPQQYKAKHITEENCSQSRSIQEPMQLSSRSKQMVGPSGENNDLLLAEAWRSGHDHPDNRFQRGDRGVPEREFHRVGRRSQDLPNALTAAEVTERLGLRNCIDTRNMNSVEADLTTGSMQQFLKCSRQRSSSRQHSMQSNLLRVKRIGIGVNMMLSGIAGNKQRKGAMRFRTR